MREAVFTVDGVSYPGVHVASLRRSFAVLDGPNAGRMMDGSLRRDVIGTYYNYALELYSDFSSPEQYDALYEALSAPVDSHDVVFPYGQENLSFLAYIANGEDELPKIYRDGLQKWDHLSLNFVAMEPQRRPL